jgi:hypothetical protein
MQPNKPQSLVRSACSIGNPIHNCCLNIDGQAFGIVQFDELETILVFGQSTLTIPVPAFAFCRYDHDTGIAGRACLPPLPWHRSA